MAEVVIITGFCCIIPAGIPGAVMDGIMPVVIVIDRNAIPTAILFF
jgi:hypothetical protein